jgi:hypothetical protein
MRGRWPAVAALLLAAGVARAATIEEESDPAGAAVFVRVIGVMRAEIQHAWKETRETQDVEIATGSGFVISPSGYVLTNHHVVSPRAVTVQGEDGPVLVQLEVKRVEVVFPADGTRLEARVEASDADLDLAVLSTSGADLPYVGLGDSDALEPGQPVQVIGFPFGRAVEVGRPIDDETVPQPTVTRGSVGALRESDEGEARYIQTDAVVHPGNSGGPMLDARGYAIGVIRMRLERGSAPGPAFAIPINRVKDFLESASLERVFPTRRLRLGPPQSLDWKRVRFRLPDGFDDASPSRLRVEWAPPQEVALFVERVASPLALSAIDQTLRDGRELPALGAVAATEPHARKMGGRPALVGRGTTEAWNGPASDVGYAVVDLGKEKLVAAYVGPPAHVAFNRSVLEGWLTSVEADALLTRELAAPVAPELEAATLPHPGAPPIAMPRGWYREPTPPSGCGGLPEPDSALLASPEGDFTVSLRAAWWRGAGGSAAAAAANCRGGRPSKVPAAYAGEHARLGVSYSVAGLFVPAGEGLLQLETWTPRAKEPHVRDLFAAWIKALVGE